MSKKKEITAFEGCIAILIMTLIVTGFLTFFVGLSPEVAIIVGFIGTIFLRESIMNEK